MSLPQDPATVENVPHGKTARRLEWPLLPPMVRRLIESRLGSRVVRTESAGAGFTPGFASVLTGENGRRLFVKAASKKAQRMFADAYREEARKLSVLAAGTPAPRLLWSHEDDLWLILGFEYVEAQTPARPWKTEQLHVCLDTLELVADRFTPPPVELRLKTFAEEFGEVLGCWDHVRTASPEWPHLEDAVALAAGFETVTAGTSLVHTDARDDNFLLTQDGGALLCDWNWPVVGAPWIDTALLLISAHGDGLDADDIVAERRLTKDVDPDHIDALLALIGGYFLQRRDQPVPSSSPYLRVHSRWWAEATWSWLASRRGWS